MSAPSTRTLNADSDVSIRSMQPLTISCASLPSMQPSSMSMTMWIEFCISDESVARSRASACSRSIWVAEWAIVLLSTAIRCSSFSTASRSSVAAVAASCFSAWPARSSAQSRSCSSSRLLRSSESSRRSEVMSAAIVSICPAWPSATNPSYDCETVRFAENRTGASCAVCGACSTLRGVCSCAAAAVDGRTASADGRSRLGSTHSSQLHKRARPGESVSSTAGQLGSGGRSHLGPNCSKLTLTCWDRLGPSITVAW